MRNVEFTHQLQTTDEQFLSHLTLPGKLGSALRQAVNDKDLAAARRIVAEHYRTRSSPRWSFYSHGSPWHETDAEGDLLEKADELLKNRFRNSWPPHQWIELDKHSSDPDWHLGLRTASTSISRHTWLSE